MITNPVVETWEINNRINLYVLDAITPDSLSDVSPAKAARLESCSPTFIMCG